MTLEESWVNTIRAESLAKLLLTERPDLEIVEGGPGVGFDLLVRVHDEDSTLIPEFAVEVKGTRGRVTNVKLREWLVNMRVLESTGQLPWCLFVFQVESRKGMFCWLHEPVIVEGVAAIRSVWEPRPMSRDRQKRLLVLPSLTTLDEYALGSIVSRVVEWAKAHEQADVRHARAS